MIGAALLSAVTLSAAGASGEGDETDTGFLEIAGQPFVEFQINQLAKQGITRIFVEIETVPGLLAAVADRALASGVTVEFVRSPSELRGKLQLDQFLFVLAENIYVDDMLLSEIATQQNAFILTVDGRDENAIFERIDLNSFWTGIAMLSAQSVESIAALPDEWSISSSLLRRALQDSVVHRPIAQDILTAKQLQKVTSTTDARLLSKQLMHRQSLAVDGVIEKFLFAPMASAFVMLLLKFPMAKQAAEIVTWLSLAITLGFALAGFPVVAAVTALISVFATQANTLLNNASAKSNSSQFLQILPTMILAASFLAILWNWSPDHSQNYAQNLHVALSVCGLFWLSKRIIGTELGRNLLCSIAMLAALTLTFAASGFLISGFMLVGLIQLGALIFISRTERTLL